MSPTRAGQWVIYTSLSNCVLIASYCYLYKVEVLEAGMPQWVCCWLLRRTLLIDIHLIYSTRAALELESGVPGVLNRSPEFGFPGEGRYRSIQGDWKDWDCFVCEWIKIQSLPHPWPPHTTVCLILNHSKRFVSPPWRKKDVAGK